MKLQLIGIFVASAFLAALWARKGKDRSRMDYHFKRRVILTVLCVLVIVGLTIAHWLGWELR
jgi:hypothetical protein